MNNTTAPKLRPEPPPSLAPDVSTLLTWGKQGWLAIAYFISGLLWWALPLTITICLIIGLSTLPIVFVGLPILLLLLALAPLWSLAERHRVKAFLGSIITPDDSPAPQTFRRFALSARRWKSLGHATLQTVWAPLAGSVILTIVCAGFLGLALPVIAALFDTQVTHFGGRTTSVLSGIAVFAVMLIVAPAVGVLLRAVDVRLAHWLLGVDESRRIKKLAGQVEGLAKSRSAAVEAAEAERQRIERDLHDGPQQQLVSIAMDVSMAKDVIDEDPEMAKEILAGVKESAKSSIAEMREVARGTIPPILTDRGLDAAVSALAARCPVPVAVSSDLTGRLPAQVESTAYFMVSEALTNVAKHSEATAVTVDLTATKTGLDVVVQDNGHGGVDPTKGTGVTGLRQRLAGLDGTLEVSSPAGGPTILTAHVPLTTSTRK